MSAASCKASARRSFERTVYDEEGQFLPACSFMDYCRRCATDAPPFETIHHPVPAKTNPLGVKGCGGSRLRAGSLTSVSERNRRRYAGVRRAAHRHAG